MSGASGRRAPPGGEGWRVDGGGAVRTPAGMLIFRWTREGDLEVMDRVLHCTVCVSFEELQRLREEWMRRGV